MPAFDDTIVAIATPPGQGGVGVVRLSGPAARRIGTQLFRPSHGATWRPRVLRHGVLADPTTGTLIDECLACLMPGPHSYTGEDVVELQCHGSPLALRLVLQACTALGARLAERGEFTLRAFLHGRLDLAQAEAVQGLVAARTATAAQVAAAGVTGALSRRLQPITGLLTGTLAYLEASIDFVEEDIPQQAAPRLAADVAAARSELAVIAQRAHHGAILHDGVRVVLAGKPNVGKSSLLNALLRRDRAIVTPIAGTTRDTLEEAADIHGIPMFLIDTAGLTETDDPIERLGIARGSQALASAGIVLAILDASAPPDALDRQALQWLRDARPAGPLVLVLNKIDLAPDSDEADFSAAFPPDLAPDRTVCCSASTGAGIDTLEDILSALALGGEQLDADAALVETARQRLAIEDALIALDAALTGFQQGRPPEIICIDLRSALEALGTITGDNVSEAVLDRIFSDFCIGK
jgi:tRNA modification GTPase